MTDTRYTQVLSEVVAEYRSLNPKSEQISSASAAVLPGGTTRTTTFFSPFPPALTEGSGSRVLDADGNSRVDYLNNYTSMILGHAHPDVVARVALVASQGTGFASPTEHEVRLAEMLVERVDSVDMVRFTNSGTEATMAALRLARAFTGREEVARVVGSYHGTHDYATTPAAGVPQAVEDLVLTIPFNDIDGCAELIANHADFLAAVIVEPVLGAGGVVKATQQFLDFLSVETKRIGALLILDEIITFRLSYGGAQALYGLTPDLTTFGKMIGGGFAIGAFGGRADVMALLHPETGSISWGGTFNGNPVSTSAGVETLSLLSADVLEDLNRKGENLASRLNASFVESDVPVQVTNAGSLFNFHATADVIVDNNAVQAADPELARVIHLGLMNRGYFVAPRGMGCLSTAMSQTDRDGLIGAVDDLVATIT